MRSVVLVALLCCAAATLAEARPPAQSVGELVERVRDAGERELAHAAERERRFLEARDQQARLLEEVRQARIAADAEADRLRTAYFAGEANLTALEATLAERSKDLTELFGTVHQVAADSRTLMTNSMVGMQHPNRNDLVDTLALADHVPGIEQLRAFWLVKLEEMQGSGQVARFPAKVIGVDGSEAEQAVTRIGAFTVLADGRYLRYLPQTGQLMALAQDPIGTRVADTRRFEAAAEPILPIAVDPSRGEILAVIVQRPGWSEQIEKGGPIGYTIIALGVIGLLIALERLVRLTLTRRQLQAALSGSGTQADVTRLEAAASAHAADGGAEALAANFDEIVSSAGRRLTRGIPIVAIFAAVAPLLGLLGTVTGMIETFLAITLFGAGDPRLMSGGISEALVTTKLGLMVAIPLLLLQTLIQGRANLILGQLDEKSARLLAANPGAART